MFSPWREANKNFVLGYTFTDASKPTLKMTMLQTVGNKANRDLVAVALINDEGAETHFRKVSRPGLLKECQCLGSCCDV
jgi:hypothetical protein